MSNVKKIYKNLTFSRLCDLVHKSKSMGFEFSIFNDYMIDGNFKEGRKSEFKASYVHSFDETKDTLIISLVEDQMALPYWLIVDNHWGLFVLTPKDFSFDDK